MQDIFSFKSLFTDSRSELYGLNVTVLKCAPYQPMDLLTADLFLFVTLTATVSACQDEPDLRDLMLLGTTSEKGIGKSANNSGAQAMRHVCGLLEVEPLHFICHATSDGTRMERMDTGMNCTKILFLNRNLQSLIYS